MFLMPGFYQATPEIHNFMWRVTAVIRSLTDLTSLHSFENRSVCRRIRLKVLYFLMSWQEQALWMNHIRKKVTESFITPDIWKWLPVLEDQLQYITLKFSFASRFICFTSILLSRQIKLRESRNQGYKGKCLLEAFIESEYPGIEEVGGRIPVKWISINPAEKPWRRQKGLVKW